MKIDKMIAYCKNSIEVLGTARTEEDDLANKEIESDVYRAILAKLLAAEAVIEALFEHEQISRETAKAVYLYEIAGRDIPG